MITITGAGDHDPPEWLITMAGIRTLPLFVVRDGLFYDTPLFDFSPSFPLCFT
jgi:hypothetical protein